MSAVEFPGHQHPLNTELLAGEESRICGLCGEELDRLSAAHECSECDFAAHLDCAKNPPSLTIEERKIHEHTLTLLARHISFTCNACGLSGDISPYVCLKCSFMIHKDCIDLPHVIKINRHHHRLYYTCFLGLGERNCQVCHKTIHGRYGAYYCAQGCSYVHPRCATRGDVWDGNELEGELEEYEEIESSITEHVGDNFIRHFSHHQHLLRFENEDIIKDIFCFGCSLPVASKPFYRCLQCDFFLHKKCANLPRKIFSAQHVHPLTLCADGERPDTFNSPFQCGACYLLFNGFRYRCLECKVHDNIIEFDVRCSSVSESLEYHLHPQHKLYFTLVMTEYRICSVCCNRLLYRSSLSCSECEFHLCFACATLAEKVIYKYDEHPLSHTLSVSNPYWCDICEMKTPEAKHLYKCSDCGPVLHTECLLGSFRNMRPGVSFTTHLRQKKYEVIFNDRTSRLICHGCGKPCYEPLLLMSTTTSTDVTIYLCSSSCLQGYDRV